MNQKLEQDAKLVIFFGVIDILWISAYDKFDFSLFYIFMMVILYFLSIYVSWLYIVEKGLNKKMIALVPLLFPLGMLILLIKKGKYKL